MEIAGFEQVCCSRRKNARLVHGPGVRIRKQRGPRVYLLAKQAKLARCMLPLKLGREPVARPARVSISFEEAQMAYGRLAQVVERTEAVHRVNAPAGVRTVVALPVERRLPALG